MVQHVLILAALRFCGLMLAAASPTSKSIVLPPGQDPWYTAPSGYETARPGDVLRLRRAPGNLTSVFSNSSSAYNILYRTVNSHSEPYWAVTTLFVPTNTTGSALLSYQIPYNTADFDGSPSYLLYTPAFTNGLVLSDIQTALSRGWYVNVPDFESPMASFTEITQEGPAVLDAVRAVLNLGIGLTSSVRYALWGYSGGSLASEAAAEIQSLYAPELNFAGVALGGVPPNVSTVLPLVNRGPFAALIPEVLLGLTSQYPEAREYVLSQLNPDGPNNKSTFLLAMHMPIDEAFTFFQGQDMYKYFADGRKSLEAPILKRLFDQKATLGFHGFPTAPVFVYKAIHDEVSPVSQTDALVEKFCRLDVNILYERNTIGGHLAEETNGDQRAIEWLDGVLSGTYQHQGCTVKNVTINITDSPL